jgi:hypothetical protein
MTMTWEVTEVDGQTRVDIIVDNVLDGIAANDHAAGLASSLANLAKYLEGSARANGPYARISIRGLARRRSGRLPVRLGGIHPGPTSPNVETRNPPFPAGS